MQIDELNQVLKDLSSQTNSITYQNTYQNITHYVKYLRHKKLPLTQCQVTNLSAISNLILSFMITKNAFQDPLYLQALITLDNTFNLSNQLLRNLFLTKDFYININRFFLHICLNIDQEENEIDLNSNEPQNIYAKLNKCTANQTYKMNFALYSVLYLIVIIIYQTNRRNDHKLFKKYLLNNKFLLHFLSLELQKNSKTQKLIGIIITFLVKTVNIKQWKQNIKKFLLNNIEIAYNHKVQFYFFYSLRAIKQSIMLNQIRKYKLLEFIICCLNRYSGTSQAHYLYELLSLFLTKYPTLGYNLLSLNIFTYLEKDLIRHQNQIFHIFQKLYPCIPTKAKRMSLQIHLKKFSQKDSSSNLMMLSLRMLTVLLEQSTISECMQTLQTKVVEFCLQKLKNNAESSEQKAIINFLTIFLERCRNNNEHLANIVYTKIMNGKKNIGMTARNYQFFVDIQHFFKDYNFSLV